MKYLILLFSIITLAATSSITTDQGLAKVNKKQGKYIFTHSEPVTDYEVVFTVNMPGLIWSDNQINSIDKIEDFVIRKANKQAEKQGKTFDALVITDWNNSIAINFKD